MNRRKMKIGSLMMLKASFLVMVFSMGVIAPAIAQNKQNRKPRKKLKELLMMADSLRLQLRQSADRDVCSNGATLFSCQNWVKVR